MNTQKAEPVAMCCLQHKQCSRRGVNAYDSKLGQKGWPKDASLFVDSGLSWGSKTGFET
jgi:hypothetical protein